MTTLDCLYDRKGKTDKGLSINLLNFLNELNSTFFFFGGGGLFIINFGDVKMRILSWPVNCIQPGQTVRMCRLTLQPVTNGNH